MPEEPFHFPKPERPLRILTIDGGGLQGISTLNILDKLLDSIARNNVSGSKPRPCDVFDVITGIGTGGWLALLLGRFQMDVITALTEWYDLLECIYSTEVLRKGLRKGLLRRSQRSHIDTTRLVERINRMADFYETENHMSFTPPSGTRCKKVFVAACAIDSKDASLGYHLFRTYRCSSNELLLPGPRSPDFYEISHAFAATGATRHFVPPWHETSAKKGNIKYLDIQFPSPHNITGLTLDEMWLLYGTDVEISLVVNIGPGTPNATDCNSITSGSSLGKKVPLADSATLPSTQPPPNGTQSRDDDPASSSSRKKHLDPNLSPTISSPVRGPEPQTPVAHHLLPLKSRPSLPTAASEERRTEHPIKEKLRNNYGEKSPPYYRFAPDESALGALMNDTKVPKAAFDSAMQCVGMPRVVEDMEEIGRLIADETEVLV